MMVQLPPAQEFTLIVRQTQRRWLRFLANFRRLFPGALRTRAVDDLFVGADESFRFKPGLGVLGCKMNPNPLSAGIR